MGWAPGEFDTLQGWTEDPFDRGKRSPVSVFTTSMVVMTGGPGDLGQTIALRPGAQTQTDNNNAMMRLSRNKTVGHCTAKGRKTASPQARLRR